MVMSSLSSLGASLNFDERPEGFNTAAENTRMDALGSVHFVLKANISAGGHGIGDNIIVEDVESAEGDGADRRGDCGRNG